MGRSTGLYTLDLSDEVTSNSIPRPRHEIANTEKDCSIQDILSSYSNNIAVGPWN